MLGSLILYIKGMRILMFQLSGFYCMDLGLVRIPHESFYRGFRAPSNPQSTTPKTCNGPKPRLSPFDALRESHKPNITKALVEL